MKKKEQEENLGTKNHSQKKNEVRQCGRPRQQVITSIKINNKKIVNQSILPLKPALSPFFVIYSILLTLCFPAKST